MKRFVLLLALAGPLAPAVAAPDKSATAAQADAYVADAEGQLQRMSPIWQQAEWVSETYITDDTEAIAARSDAEHTALQVRLAKGAARFDGVKGLSPETRRKLDLLKLTITLP